MEIKRRWEYLIIIIVHSILFALIYNNIESSYITIQDKADKLMWLYIGSFFVSVVVAFFYAFSSYRKYSALQLLCFWFLPYITLIYFAIIKGELQDADEKEKRTKRKNLNSSEESLYKLKERSILSEEEYNAKIKQVKTEKLKIDFENSEEYKELKSLFNKGLLTEQEFNDKVNIVKSKIV